MCGGSKRVGWAQERREGGLGDGVEAGEEGRDDRCRGLR